MVDIVAFPAVLQLTDRSDPMLMQNTRSGGVAINGDEQVLSPLSGRWEWRVTFPVRNAVQVRSLRLFKSRMKGRFNYARLGLCDRYRITMKAAGLIGGAAVPFSDGATFDDGSIFAAGSLHSPVTVAAAAGAVELRVRASDFGAAMTAGVFFSVNDWLNQIEDLELDGADYVLQLASPLREAVAEGDEIDLGGTALWALAADEAGDIDLRLGKLGMGQLTFVEPVGRRLKNAS